MLLENMANDLVPIAGKGPRLSPSLLVGAKSCWEVVRVQGYWISKKRLVREYGRPIRRMLNKGKTSSLDADRESKRYAKVGKTPTNAIITVYCVTP